jgi:hypothetical protein
VAAGGIGGEGGTTRAVTTATRRLRRACFVAIAFLYAVSIPWYRPSGAVPAVVLGLPDWVAVALGCYLLAALLNAAAWWLTVVDDPPDGDGAEAR